MWVHGSLPDGLMPWESAGAGVDWKPGATGTACFLGCQQALEWIRGLSSLKPSRNLEPRNLPGSTGPPVATEPSGAPGVGLCPGGLGA